MKHKVFGEILISLSLANLLYLASWRELLYPATYDYHIKYGADTRDFLSVVLCVILTAALLYGGLQIARYFFGEKLSPLVNLSFLVSILIAVNVFRIQFLNASNSFIIGIAFQTLVISALAATLTKWRNALFNFAKMLILMLSPFVLITFSQAVWGIMNPPSILAVEVPISMQLATVKPNADNKIKNRVMYIIFDEFDYRVPFVLKPIELLEFERLKRESLSATNAKSPAWTTVESLPSLLTGKQVKKSETMGKSELILSFANGETGKFRQEPNLFFDVKALNGNVAALGWYHPYCRLFGKVLSACKWEGNKFSLNLSLPETMLVNVKDFFAQLPTMFSLESTSSINRFAKESHHVFKESEFDPAVIKAAYVQRTLEMKEIAVDPHIDLVFFHLPMPHAPVQYNRFLKDFTQERQDYISNLALCDDLLGELRKTMEDAGLWDSTTVIISSDHQWRVNTWKEQARAAKLSLTDYDLELTQGIEDPRVPFFVKLKNQTESVTYERAFNTLITRELIAAIMKGEISSPAELKTRLDAAPDFTAEHRSE